MCCNCNSASGVEVNVDRLECMAEGVGIWRLTTIKILSIDYSVRNDSFKFIVTRRFAQYPPCQRITENVCINLTSVW